MQEHWKKHWDTWVLEINLGENNAELAMVHATHPISELYHTMSGHLEANPEFDQKLQQTLLELKDRASTDVSQSQAQTAIDNAKEIIEEAREVVVGQKLSDKPEFKMRLINQLLETSKVEYREAVSDGIIEEVTEFQDGSAFIWQSQQIFNTIKDIKPVDLERINERYEQVWSDFDSRANPADVTDSIDAIIYEFEELSGIQSVASEHKQAYLAGLSPLKQLREGAGPENIQCRSLMELIFKPSGDPACVKSSNIQKLVDLGWSR